MNEVLAALDQRGLVVRRAGKGRAIGTRLTPAARAALAECDTAVDALEREMLADLTRSEIQRLRAALAACSRRLEMVDSHSRNVQGASRTACTGQRRPAIGAGRPLGENHPQGETPCGVRQ
jgi:hypothetical protein